MKTARERKLEILAVLQSCVFSLTVGEVGKEIGLKRSPYLIGLLLSMVESGEISMEWAEHPQYGNTRFFWIKKEGK